MFDRELGIEAYRICGVARPFPVHFHEHYVLGYMERGARQVVCRGDEWVLKAGDVIVFNPGDGHGCVESDGKAMDYRGLNISQERMRELVGQATGARELPRFRENVICDKEVARCLWALHGAIMGGAIAGTAACRPGTPVLTNTRKMADERNGLIGTDAKLERLLLLVSLLLEQYGQEQHGQAEECGREPQPRPHIRRAEVEAACRFIEREYASRISLDQLCNVTGLSTSAMLRAFVRERGITPYRYLESVRIQKAQELLMRGASPADAAGRTGFSDQSHLSNVFERLTGLTPGAYQSAVRGGGHSEAGRQGAQP